MSAGSASSPLPPLREVIARFGLDARKKLGQHFLLDANLTAKIVRSAGDLGGITVIEIGPGPGGLTRALLNSEAARVIAVEKDTRCIDALNELARHYPGRVEIVEQDALTFDPIKTAPAPRAIVANLPYNVGTALLLGWLEHSSAYQHMTLMFQREVAERLTARPGSKSYGRLSVIAQWRCQTTLCFHLPGRAFTPPPKVESSVVRLIPRSLPDDAPPFAAMEAVTAAAFGQRRKMLRSSLSALGDSRSLLDAARLDPTRRAESLSVDDFVRLARQLSRVEREGSAAAP